MRLRNTSWAVAAVLVVGSLASGQQQAVDFRADVELVLLHVAVIDPRGNDVPPLTADDFKVFDDGLEQSIELFVTPSDAPLDVALVLDSSASMRPVEISAKRAAVTFLQRMAVNDCVFVLPFSEKIRPGRWGRSGDPALRGFIDQIVIGGGTSLYDALLEGLATLERADAQTLVARAEGAAEGGPGDPGEAPPEPAVTSEVAAGEQPPATTREAESSAPPRQAPIDLPPRRPSLRSKVGAAVRELDLAAPPAIRGCGEPLPVGVSEETRRRALVVLSDGADLDSRADRWQPLQAARAASVPVFPVAMGYANSDPALRSWLDEVARATGGRLIENAAADGLAASYDRVVTLLRSYYLIGYDPDPVGGPQASAPARPRWHDVRVELRRPNFEPLVRPGYYR